MSKYQSINSMPLLSNEILSNRTEQIKSYVNSAKEIYDQYQLKNLLRVNKHEYVSLGKVEDTIFKSVLVEIDKFFREKKLLYLVKFNDYTLLHVITCGCVALASEISIAIPDQVKYMNRLYKTISSKQRGDMLAFYHKIEIDGHRDLYLIHNYQSVLVPLGYQIYATYDSIVIEV